MPGPKTLKEAIEEENSSEFPVNAQLKYITKEAASFTLEEVHKIWNETKTDFSDNETLPKLKELRNLRMQKELPVIPRPWGSNTRSFGPAVDMENAKRGW